MLTLNKIYFKYNKKSDFILKNITLNCNINEKIAIIAPSGYGKSTLAKIASGYIKPTFGDVLWQNQKLVPNRYSPIQLIHQNPEQALNPKITIKKSLHESNVFNDKNLLDSLEIKEEFFYKYPKELSGGELQRVSIARALNEKTKFLIADEITSMLDMISQVEVWNLLLNILSKRETGLIMITHDKNLAYKISDKVIYLNDINDI